MNDVRGLVQAALAAVNQGRWNEAEQIWHQVLAIDPRHPQALYSVGVHAFKRGQLSEALQALQAAHAAAPQDPVVLLSVAAVLREQGDRVAELKAIEACLAADPYFLPGLLAKATHLEQHGQRKDAAVVYGNALKVAPAQAQWPAALRPQLQHAHELVQTIGTEMAAYLAQQTGTRMAALTPSEAERWREAGALLSGQTEVYPSKCARFQVPRLPAIPFFERSAFDWVEALEAKTEAITAELMAALAHDRDEFTPYITYQPGAPVNQWGELNHSSRWSGYFLWRNGEPETEHLKQCPQTALALEGVDQADLGGLCPNAMFSALAPHTTIPAHHGETNARVVVHLPLVVPDNCLYRVGFERRRWKVGEVLIFDDSIEHEARNDSDELRVVMIFDVWNPLLSAGERDMARAISNASRKFHSLP